MQHYLLYIPVSKDEAYECAYSILKYLEAYNLKPPPDHELVIYTSYPQLLEAYGSFFNHFQLYAVTGESISKEIIKSNFKQNHNGPVLYLETNSYPVNKIDSLFSENPAGNNPLETYELKEFRVLLRHFFERYQEESVPNQVKLAHAIDAKKIQEQKRKFRQLPLVARWLRQLTGQGFHISRFQKKI
jgi:hypothetical protein